MSDLVFPKNGGQFLLDRITELHGQVADLIDEVVKRDQANAEKDAQIAALAARLKPDASDSHHP